ncbi:MAG TPA: FdrA family protein, partial [Candidatus Ozemobacteraceae bacterium]
PPAAAVLAPLYAELKKIRKPIVVYFIGADPEAIRKEGFTPAHNLQEAAQKACELSGGKPVQPPMSEAEAASKAKGLTLPGRYLRGLYSGGTLCDEAQRLLQPVLGELYSNTPVKGCKTLQSVHKSEKHTIVDLGDDEFTRGRAHPMIDPTLRQERIGIETADPDVGLIAFDVVLGYGSHMDMAGEMVAAIEKARKASGRKPVFAACICGTADDPQNMQKQKRTLEEAGVLVFPSNVALVTFVKQALSGKGA